jgi:hypothetical protein
LFSGVACAREQITDFTEASLPILNDELQRLSDDINKKVTSSNDKTAVDFAVGAFTTDATWRDLAKIPEGTKGVLLSVEVKDDAAGSYIMFRRNGFYNAINVATIATQVANVSNFGELFVPVDNDRKVEYKGSNLAFVTINVTIRGYIK